METPADKAKWGIYKVIELGKHKSKKSNVDTTNQNGFDHPEILKSKIVKVEFTNDNTFVLLGNILLSNIISERKSF